ncbi:hypothetical protein [Pedobacter heparinus]|uniref:hypothetical protein n=1 Tax=Pedobacter heparinus TaxID=984 RepID=UPI00292CD6F5|nr:hypothetical protein [Pedobacter heparinus]
MYSSKFKLALHWLLIAIGFYIFWGFSYLILAKFSSAEISRFLHSKESIWSQLTAADIFWYVIFIFGIALGCYVIKLCVKYSPNDKVAAILYTLLIISSVAIFVDKLLESTTFLHIIPHIVINIAFLIPMGQVFFKADDKVPETKSES